MGKIYNKVKQTVTNKRPFI